MKKEITEDIKSAMRSGDKVRLETVRSISAAITNYEKANAGSDLDVSKILRALANQRKMAIEAYENAAQADRADSEKLELAIIQEYIDKFLPKQMSEAEIKTVLEEIVVGLGGMEGKPAAFMGRIMGEFMKRHKDQADPKLVGQVLKGVLNA